MNTTTAIHPDSKVFSASFDSFGTAIIWLRKTTDSHVIQNVLNLLRNQNAITEVDQNSRGSIITVKFHFGEIHHSDILKMVKTKCENALLIGY